MRVENKIKNDSKAVFSRQKIKNGGNLCDVFRFQNKIEMMTFVFV